MNLKLLAPQPPRLPDPPEAGYTTGYFNLLLKTLRIYFAQLGNALGAVLGNEGATYLQTVYGEYKSLVDQTIVSTTTAYVVTFNSTVFENGCTLVSGSRMTVPREGIYKLAVNLQFSSADPSIRDVTLWFRKNGVDIPNTGARFSVPERHGGVNGALGAEVVQYFDLQPNDYMEIVWYATDTDVKLEYLPAGASPTRPACASATATIIFVSAFTTL